jgi:hypothetical protein
MEVATVRAPVESFAVAAANIGASLDFAHVRDISESSRGGVSQGQRLSVILLVSRADMQVLRTIRDYSTTQEMPMKQTGYLM